MHSKCFCTLNEVDSQICLSYGENIARTELNCFNKIKKCFETRDQFLPLLDCKWAVSCKKQHLQRHS